MLNGRKGRVTLAVPALSLSLSPAAFLTLALFLSSFLLVSYTLHPLFTPLYSPLLFTTSFLASHPALYSMPLLPL